MRLSVMKGDPGYHKKAHWFRVYLDDHFVDHCFTADEDAGCLWKYKTDENGRILMNDQKTEVLTEQLFGHVELVLEKGRKAA